MKDKKQNIEKEHSGKGISRRNFASRSVLGLAGLTIASTVNAGESKGDNISNWAAQNTAKRKLGSLEVSPIGLGCMSMTSGHYNPPRSFEEMEPVIRGAVDRGVNFFDTAEVYGPFTNAVIVRLVR